jgi:F0F1-type ATP synthase membrane subunit b/b'
MLKELLESLGIGKEVRIAVYAICVTAVAMYFICGNFIFPERNEILNQYKSDVDNIKSVNQDQSKKLEEYSLALDQRNSKLNELNGEISTLQSQSCEQVLPEWRKALDNERSKSSNLQDQINQLIQNTKDLKQVSDNCMADANNIKANNLSLNNIVSGYTPLLSKINEIKEIESNKNSVEEKLAELDGNDISRPFNIEKIQQLKRISAEYQQQIIQLQQCEK